MSSSSKGDNASDIIIEGIISCLVTGGGDKLPSQGQPYCKFKVNVVQEISLVQNVKFVQFAGFFKGLNYLEIFLNKQGSKCMV